MSKIAYTSSSGVGPIPLEGRPYSAKAPKACLRLLLQPAKTPRHQACGLCLFRR